jgi:hypothetical protein
MVCLSVPLFMDRWACAETHTCTHGRVYTHTSTHTHKHTHTHTCARACTQNIQRPTHMHARASGYARRACTHACIRTRAGTRAHRDTHTPTMRNSRSCMLQSLGRGRRSEKDAGINNNNNNYTFPVWRPGVHLDHLRITR